MVSMVLDQFGKDVIMRESEPGYFDITVDVSVSPVFLGWMFQLGRSASIKGPKKLINAMRQLLKENNWNYDR